MAIPTTGNRDRRAAPRELQMNHSIVTADRNTHLKVGVLALAAALGVALVGFSAHVDDSQSRWAVLRATGQSSRQVKSINSPRALASKFARARRFDHIGAGIASRKRAGPGDLNLCIVRLVPSNAG